MNKASSERTVQTHGPPTRILVLSLGVFHVSGNARIKEPEASTEKISFLMHHKNLLRRANYALLCAIIQRSTNEAMEKMENEKIRCWKMTQRKMKWRLAMRISTSQNERWLIKAAEWNPELSSKYRTNRSIGRQEKDGKMTSTNSSNKLRIRLKI